MKNNMLLEIENLNVTYETLNKPVAAVRNLSLSLKQNESLGIIGESGCGKSTLSYAIMGYLSSNGRSCGKIFFNGEDLLEKNQREMMRYRGDRIAMVYQNPYSSLNPSLTIGRQLDEVTIFHRKLLKKEAREASLEALRDLSIGDAEGTARRYPHQISGGMQQRVCIAMALLCRPDLMILDEPTTALDVTTEAVILDIIGALKDKYKMSLIYISHDIGIVNKISDRIAVMYAGELVETGPKKLIFDKPSHPYTRALINCIPRSGVVKEKVRLNTIPGFVRRRGTEEKGCPYADRCEKKAPGCEEIYGMAERSDGRLSACDRAYASDIPEKKKDPLKTPSGNGESNENILEIIDLYKYYKSAGTKVRALDGVSLSMESNQVLGIVGESGCGKSTLGLTISGLITPTRGILRFKEEDISVPWQKRHPKVLKDLQLIFQNPGRSLNPSFTLEKIIGRPMKKLLGIYSREERRNRTIDILRRVDLDKEYLNRKASQLSGGELQRAAIARAFSISPELIVCDEPTSALDVSVQASVLNLLGDLQQGSRISYIFISHDLYVINYISDYIMVMYLGRICEYGKKEEVVGPPYHPYTEALMSAVPDVDPSLEKMRIRLSGSPPNPTKKIKGCPFSGRCHRKIGEICDNTPPPKVEFSSTHFAYCHLPGAVLFTDSKNVKEFMQ